MHVGLIHDEQTQAVGFDSDGMFVLFIHIVIYCQIVNGRSTHVLSMFISNCVSDRELARCKQYTPFAGRVKRSYTVANRTQERGALRWLSYHREVVH